MLRLVLEDLAHLGVRFGVVAIPGLEPGFEP
jgi:hypothetical protein